MSRNTPTKTVIIIPARFKSTRFPGKPLIDIKGIPMVVRVANIAANCVGYENTYIATDDDRIAKTAINHDLNYLMTSERCLTGTDRLYEAAQQVDADIYINIQGDEPLVNPSDVQLIIDAKKENPNKIVCGMKELSEEENPANKNLPIVATNYQNDLIYMSRLPIPGYKEEDKKPKKYYKQVCIYAFNLQELKAFYEYGKKGKAELSEDIEILRFFELGIPIKMVNTLHASYAVDEPSDVEKIIQELNKKIEK